MGGCLAGQAEAPGRRQSGFSLGLLGWKVCWNLEVADVTARFGVGMDRRAHLSASVVEVLGTCFVQRVNELRAASCAGACCVVPCRGVAAVVWISAGSTHAA